MIAFLLGIALVAQPTFNNGPPPSMPPPPHVPASQDWRDPPTARRALDAFGACLADRNAVVARSALAMDYASRNYTRRVAEMVSRDEDCFRLRGGRMAFDYFSVAGAMAERMIEREPQPLNVRLARAALGPAGSTFSPADRVAMCVVRSVPDQVSALLTSVIDSPAEEELAASLMSAFAACSQHDVRLSLSTSGVRATLATAAYRSLLAGAGRR